jgi:hypothetical protein
MNSSTGSTDFAEFYELFDRCNHSELYQLARHAGLVVLPNFSREALIRILIGQDEPPDLYHDIDEWRRALMRFVIDHRRVLETQLTCPAKSFKEDACFGCVDAQVINCVTSNGKENQRLIQLRKKTK